MKKNTDTWTQSSSSLLMANLRSHSTSTRLTTVNWHVRVYPTLCTHPLELSVRDEQLILTAAAGKRGLKELVTALFRQLLHHYLNIWKVKQIMGESVSTIMVATRV